MKNKTTLPSAAPRSKVGSEDERRRVSPRRVWLRVAAAFLLVVFLASECATLFTGG